ncbi:MAG: homoserine dehydrogenase [Selenomonadaceae bacterium]|nr:homoserine dehydrogenase [Selenomonadaceae bacterium]
MQKMKIALLGAGTVGSGVVEVLRKNFHEISQKANCEIEISKILVRNLNRPRQNLDGIELVDRFEKILEDPEIKIVVEVMGGIHPALDYMLESMKHGKSVVTANKDAIAEHGKDLFEAAEKFQVDFLFEASVGGGIPIIMPLKECLTANRITEILGIVNGTTNYMLTKMSESHADYDSVLKEAQAKGFAESDPSADVDGLDAARKAAILSSIAFNSRIQLQDVHVEGISKIKLDDIEYAKSLGYVIKLLAVGKETDRGIDVRVHPTFISKDHPLASVNGVFNAIYIRGNAIGEVMFFGPGAGSLPTASAVVADIIEAARGKLNGTFGRVKCTCYDQKPHCPIEETRSSYYVRLLVDDKPGVLGKVATAFGDENVSLRSVVQTKCHASPDHSHAEIVAITHEVEHRKIIAALERLKNLDSIDEIQSVIRVDSEENS